MKAYIFHDIETTGSCPIRNGPCVVSRIVCDENINVLKSDIFYVRPSGLSKKTWSSEAEKIHGIKYSDVEKYPDSRTFCMDYLWSIKNVYESFDDIRFVCHASGNKFYGNDGEVVWPFVDYRFIEWQMKKEGMYDSFFKLYGKNKIISTVDIARGLGFKGNRLNQWAERVGFKLKHHDPESDNLCCVEIYKYFKNNEYIINDEINMDKKNGQVYNESQLRLF